MRRFLDWLDDFLEDHIQDILNVGTAIMVVLGVVVVLVLIFQCLGLVDIQPSPR